MLFVCYPSTRKAAWDSRAFWPGGEPFFLVSKIRNLGFSDEDGESPGMPFADTISDGPTAPRENLKKHVGSRSFGCKDIQRASSIAFTMTCLMIETR